MSLQTADESLFWYWISERHSIFLKRQTGQSKPWTGDPILMDYKFTNPFRENDRGTVWLRENFLVPHRDVPQVFVDKNDEQQYLLHAERNNLELLAFNICWYRMFNWWGTGQFLGWQTQWDREDIIMRLTIEHQKGKQIFTGAHIVYSPPGQSKIGAIVNVCTDLFNLREKLVNNATHYHELQAVFIALTNVHCVGGFMAYEMVSDMRHTRLLEDATDIMTWANPGPGAKRGLQRLSMPYKRDEDAIKSMQILLVHGGLEFLNQKDFPLLEMRDIEHSLCEFDKYCRVKFGEGFPRGRYNGR